MADAGKIVITPKGAYSSTKTYEWLDEVSYNGNAYVALKTVTGVTPSDDGVNWRLFMSSADVDANVLVPKFTEASTRSNIVSGENLSTMFGKIKKWFTDLKSHAFKDLVNNLTTETTGSALDASQGKILKDEVDGVNASLDVLGKCKNEFNPTLATSTQSGVTCTNNNDGTYTLSGTNSGSSAVFFQLGLISISGTKNMRCLKGSTAISYLTKVNDFGYIRNDGVYTFDDDTYVLTVKVDIGVTVNSVAKPMVTDNLNATYDDFVPYTGDGESLTNDVAQLKNDLLSLNKTITENYTTNTDFSKIVGGTVSSAGLTNIEYTIPTEISSAGLGTQSNNGGTLVDALKTSTSKITDFFKTFYDEISQVEEGDTILDFSNNDVTGSLNVFRHKLSEGTYLLDIKVTITSITETLRGNGPSVDLTLQDIGFEDNIIAIRESECLLASYYPLIVNGSSYCLGGGMVSTENSTKGFYLRFLPHKNTKGSISSNNKSVLSGTMMIKVVEQQL